MSAERGAHSAWRKGQRAMRTGGEDGGERSDRRDQKTEDGGQMTEAENWDN